MDYFCIFYQLVFLADIPPPLADVSSNYGIFLRSLLARIKANLTLVKSNFQSVRICFSNSRIYFIKIDFMETFASKILLKSIDLFLRSLCNKP